jgi:hypothetical protein
MRCVELDDEMGGKEQRILNLLNAQWITRRVLQLRPSTVISLGTSTTSQTVWRSKAREHEAEPRLTKVQVECIRRGNSRAWSQAAPRLSSARESTKYSSNAEVCVRHLGVSPVTEVTLGLYRRRLKHISFSEEDML